MTLRMGLMTTRFLQRYPKSPSCGICHRTVCAGQYILTVTPPGPGRLHESTSIHASCLKELVATVPEDELEPKAAKAAFEKIRRELIESGAS